MDSSNHGHSATCETKSKSDTANFNYLKKDAANIGFKKNDTVISIGVGSGWREFMYSIFTDSITFYLEDIDTSCVTCKKIKNNYKPKM